MKRCSAFGQKAPRSDGAAAAVGEGVTAAAVGAAATAVEEEGVGVVAAPGAAARWRARTARRSMVGWGGGWGGQGWNE